MHEQVCGEGVRGMQEEGTEKRRLQTKKWPRQPEHSGKGTGVHGAVRENCKQGGT